MTILLLAALGLFAVTAARRARPSGPEQPIGPGAEHFESTPNGELRYTRSMARQLIRGLVGEIASDAGAPNTLLLQRSPAGPVGLADGGAYWVLEQLHDGGYALWVPTTFHYPQQREIGTFVVYLPPGEPAPSPDYALLITPAEAWPTLR